MAMVKTQVELAWDVETVWERVASLTDYAWRSDLEGLEAGPGGRFVEYAKGGYATTFTTTALVPLERWEFDLENGNITGHWTGLFTQKGGHTLLDLTEDVTAKRLLMRPFVKGYLKKQQGRYIADLKRALAGG